MSRSERFTDKDIRKVFPSDTAWKKVKGDIFCGRTPHWQDIQQKSIGDCYLLVVLKALALRNPDIIKKIIKEGPDSKTVTVRLFEPVLSPNGSSVQGFHSVEYILDKSCYDGKKNRHHASWVELIEKAYALHRIRVDAESHQKEGYRKTLDSGYPRDCYRHILGVDAHMRNYASSYKDRLIEQDVPFFLDEFSYELYCSLIDDGVVGDANRFAKTNFCLPADRDKVSKIFAEDADDFLNNFPYDKYKEFHELVLEGKVNQNQAELEKLLPAMKKQTIEKLVGYLNSMDDLVYQEIHDALRGGEYVAAGTPEQNPLRKKNIIPKHAYHVVDAVKAADGKKYIVLENPWGTTVPESPELQQVGDSAIFASPVQQEEYGLAGGSFILSIEDFIEQFKAIHISNIKETALQAQKEVDDFERDIEGHKQDIRGHLDAISQKSVDSGISEDSAIDSNEGGFDSVSVVSEDSALDSEYDMEISPRAEVLALKEQKLQGMIRERVEYLHEVGASSTVSRSSFTQSPEAMLPQLAVDLDAYLSKFDKQQFSQKSKTAQWSHRLFNKGADRYINQDREDRANTLLALVKAYDSVKEPSDKDAILKLILDIKKQHEKDVSRIGHFHGNRLGKILEKLGDLGVRNKSAALSSEGTEVLGAALKAQGFSVDDKKGLAKQPSGKVLVAALKIHTDTLKYQAAYKRYKQEPAERSAEKNPAAMFRQPSVHKVNLFPDRGEDIAHPGMGSSFN
jgi:hypothetical protein